MQNISPEKNDTILRHVESLGGVKIALTTLALFVGYVIAASIFPDTGIVKALQAHSSTGQVVALFGVILLALLELGGRTMLFRIKESRKLDELVESTAALAQRVEVLEADSSALRKENAELRLENARLQARNGTSDDTPAKD